MRTHLVSLVLYSLVVAALFSLFLREDLRERVRFTAWLAGSMLAIAAAAGWIMSWLG